MNTNHVLDIMRRHTSEEDQPILFKDLCECSEVTYDERPGITPVIAGYLQQCSAVQIIMDVFIEDALENE